MTRRESREAAMCLLYEYSFNTHKTPGEILGGAAENREEKLSGFARELFTGACGRLPEIDAILAASAENWRLHRIARGDDRNFHKTVFRDGADNLIHCFHLRIFDNIALHLAAFEVSPRFKYRIPSCASP